MKLMELMKEVDKFMDRNVPSGTAPEFRERVKVELLELLQKAVDHGEGKDQGKITGVVTGIIKNFWKKD